jgi:heme A synthase
VRLRVIHPLIAVLAYLYLIGLSVLGPAVAEKTRPGARAALERPMRVLTVLATAQIAGGFLTLLLLAPLWLQLSHLLLADLVWIALVTVVATAARPS